MKRQRGRILNDALEDYFSIFGSTRSLATELIRKRKNPIEVLILLCARLDATASDAASEAASSKKAFVHFLTAYGGNKDLFESVSVGDLYYELVYHRWLLEGTIPKAGRLHRFSEINDPIIRLFEGAGLPITLKDSAILLGTLMRILKDEFRCTPRQPLSKARTVKVARFFQRVVSAFEKTRLRAIAANLPKALGDLTESKKVCTILYERFRCESIHGATIILNAERFFSETGVYWEPRYSDYYGAFEMIEFSAQFLLGCLERCIETYRRHLLAKGKIPPNIHFHGFGDEMMSGLAFLDEEFLPEGGAVRFKIG